MQWKQQIKRLVSTVSRPIGGASQRVVVLLYHSIADGRYSTSPSQFREHLDWLEANCEIVSLADVPTILNRPAREKPAVAITFDDGYLNNYTHAFPLLATRSLPATFFVTSGFIDRNLPTIDRFRRFTDSAVEPMTWAQVGEMAASGMRIGAHTVSHPNLATIGEKLAQREIFESKQAIEDRTGVEVSAFAYPFGKPKHHFTPDTIEMVRRGGFEMAVTVCYRGIAPGLSAFEVPRFAIGADTVTDLAGAVAGNMDLLGRWQELAPRWISHMLSPQNSHRQELSFLEGS